MYFLKPIGLKKYTDLCVCVLLTCVHVILVQPVDNEAKAAWQTSGISEAKFQRDIIEQENEKKLEMQKLRDEHETGNLERETVTIR